MMTIYFLTGFLLLAVLLLIVLLLAAHFKNKRLQLQLDNSNFACTSLELKCAHLQQGLYKEHEIFHLIQDYMTESILILDDCDKISLINNSAVSLLKIDTALLESHSIFTLTNNADFLHGLRLTKKNGSARLLLSIDDRNYRAYIQRIAFADHFGTIILLIDVTESVQAENIRREFTENVSHELKTPLTVIKGFGEMFGSGMIQQPEDVQKYGAMIRRESERLLFLINDIIRLSEIEQSHEHLFTELELYDIASDAAAMLCQKAADNHITVTVEDTHIRWRVNESYMRELFVNLIDNAIKYNNPNGWVKISFSKTEKPDSVVITVSDNGIGIPAAAQSRIFERFYRVDKSRSKESGGTGLGLSIVKHIVEYHNGSILLKSVPEVGTQISIVLPLTPSA